jgi:hypothetical protein
MSVTVHRRSMLHKTRQGAAACGAVLNEYVLTFDDLSFHI